DRGRDGPRSGVVPDEPGGGLPALRGAGGDPRLLLRRDGAGLRARQRGTAFQVAALLALPVQRGRRARGVATAQASREQERGAGLFDHRQDAGLRPGRVGLISEPMGPGVLLARKEERVMPRCWTTRETGDVFRELLEECEELTEWVAE